MVPAWQFAGEACVIDCRDLRDNAPAGQSSLIKKERVIAWEKQHRPLGPGDVVLFHSGYSDAYYKPLPQGRRFAADPLAKQSPAWPDPDPECMEYLAERKVMTLGTDSASMGPLLDLAEPTHFAGLKHGMIWTESATGLRRAAADRRVLLHLEPQVCRRRLRRGTGLRRGRRPAGQAAHRLGPEEERRRSLGRARRRTSRFHGRAPGVGHHRQPFVTIRFGLNPNTRLPFDMHMLDSHSGTHLVPPSYALPDEGFDDKTLRTGSAGVAGRVREEVRPARHERHHDREGADRTDLRACAGDRRPASRGHDATRRRWPASPEITAADIENDEKAHGELRPGDVVIFHSGWSDRFSRPLPLGKACLEDPLNGKSEGWPAPGPDAIVYLAGKGVRCVATDAPTLGGVEPKRALMTYWALGGKGMAGRRVPDATSGKCRGRPISCSPPSRSAAATAAMGGRLRLY